MATTHGKDIPQIVIGARVLSLVKDGMDVIDAFRAVCGAEHVDAMIDALYVALKADSARKS